MLTVDDLKNEQGYETGDYEVREKETNKFIRFCKTESSAIRLKDRLDKEAWSHKYYVVNNAIAMK